MKSELFDNEFSVQYALDVGVLRSSNQDQVILCPEIGFFAVSDGMGGLAQGGKTSEIIAEVLPDIINEISEELCDKKADVKKYGRVLCERVGFVSDNIFDIVNTQEIGFGATLSCVWLIGDSAVYVNLGDSRGYLLPRCKRKIRQITEDHNISGELLRLGEITKEEMQGHPASSRLTRFMGMPAPAYPDLFIEQVASGDRILLCSDGLSGMLNDDQIVKGLRCSKSPRIVCDKLIGSACNAGGHDNISLVYIKVGDPNDRLE